MRKKYLLLAVYFVFFIGLVSYEIMNPPFSRDAAKVGNYEVQVYTTPSVPDVGKHTKVHFTVLDQDGNLVDRFRMGLKIYYNEELVKEFPPAEYSGTWNTDYVFEEPGNHVFEVMLFDLSTGNTYSYDFNITTLSLYTSIFTTLVFVGVGGAGGIVLAIFLLQKRTKTNFRY